ncbi:hypothetical protein EES42_42595 [Streptomyces sp. ADI95-17]|nr:hypothetical protein EES42_42595 [Streptomyces sp. ADI95-17]
MGMRRVRTPAAAHSPSHSSRASRSPETTAEPGPFTAAKDSRDPYRSTRSPTQSASRATDVIPPRPDSGSVTRRRSATSRAPSSSDRPPATTAAAISPCEWPSTAPGSTPTDRHTSASDTMIAHSTGCMTSTRSDDGAPCSPRTTSSNDQSTYGARAAPHSVSRAANTGEDSRSPAAMPAHCAPWPGNTNTGRVARAATPRTTPGAEPPRASAARPARKSSCRSAITATRCSSWARVVDRDQATSATSSGVACSASGRSSR